MPPLPPKLRARCMNRSGVAAARMTGIHVETGVFQAHMAVSLVNDGPVTLLVESAT